MKKNTICLWYDHDAEEAAHFYARTFPDSTVRAVHRAPSDFPGGNAGDVLTVEFTVCGVPCLGLNGGDTFKHSERGVGVGSHRQRGTLGAAVTSSATALSTRRRLVSGDFAASMARAWRRWPL